MLRKLQSVSSSKGGVVLIIGGTRFLGRHLVEAVLARNHEVTLFNRGKSNPDFFPQFSNDPWRSRYLQRPGHYDVLVMAIRCSRVFTGQQFSNGRATVPLDRGIGVETGHIELDESWQVTDYPTATVLPGLIDTHVILLRTVRWVPWIASRFGDEELDAVITEELQRQLAAGVTARDLGDGTRW